MGEKPTVLIDMDGVEADFDAEVTRHLVAYHPEIELNYERKNFYISEDYPEHVELVRSLSDKEGFFRSLPVVDHALLGWRRIIELGYHPRICSSPLSSNPHSESEKLAWLDEHFTPVFGKYVVEQAIITSKKHEVNGIALIDDSPVIRDAEKARWTHIIFNRPYNRGVPGLRLLGWLDNNLPNLLHQAAINYKRKP